MDYRDYCNLESYLFGPVGTAFRENGCLSTFEFFCIVIWKAERAKSRIAVRLLKRGHNSLDEAVRELTTEIARSRTPKEKLYCLVEKWGFRLPMASAILAVLYPDEFTVYDIRVCDMLGDETFKSLVGRRFSDDLWREYQRFCERVKAETPAGLSLRDKDRYLWGKSFHQGLKEDIETKFQRLRRSNP